MITTGGVNNDIETQSLYMNITSELCFPSTRPGTRFTDGWAGGLE